MKAVISAAPGIENVRVLEVADPPQPMGDQILVAIKAAGINQRDLINIENYARWNRKDPIIGCDGAGEVVALDVAVTRAPAAAKPFNWSQDR